MSFAVRNLHSTFRFTLGIVRHPRQAWHRVREIIRIANSPSLSDLVPSDELVDVEVIPVGSDEKLQEKLIAMYKDNPSPYVHGPKVVEQLQEKLVQGIQYFLIANCDGEFVGARAFDPSRKTLQNSVTDFRHRGNGYQLASGPKIRKILAKAGHTEFFVTVLRTNIRVQRTLRAAGWKMEPHPDDSDLVRGTLRLDG